MEFTEEMQQVNAELVETDDECHVAKRIVACSLAMMKRWQLPVLKEEGGVWHVE
ncbi:hypothetical protein [Planococcus soli]|uniref:hypothetical protein n=1 Tax=Planococcus soli TaxID=2666072 RepID=UPI00163D4B75|nr:hypothetical protein [Planococcus soli]